MRAFRVCGCCLLLLPLLGVFGCSRSASYVKKGPEVKTDTVKILANCTADPDTAGVPRGHTLTWNVPDSTYTIHFPKNKPIASADPTPGHGQSVTGDFGCNYLGGISDTFCVYEYDVMKDSKKCSDPGIHVIPGT
jgi:hypothetical protein